MIYGQSQNLDSLNQYYGWEENTHFIDQKVKFASITFIEVIKNNQSLFVSDSSGCYRIINLETGKLEYISYGNKPKVFAIYKDSVVYSVGENSNRFLSDTIFFYDLKSAQIVNSIRIFGGSFGPNHEITNNQYSFHKSNHLVTSGYVLKFGGYGAFWAIYASRIYSLDSLKFVLNPKILTGDAINFLWGKDSSLSSNIYFQNDGPNFNPKYYVCAKNKLVNYNFQFMNGFKLFDNTEKNLFVAYNNQIAIGSLEINGKYVINKIDDNIFQFALDNRNRVLFGDLLGSKLVIYNWKNFSNYFYKEFKDTIGKSRIISLPDNQSILLASSKGILRKINFKSIDSLKANFVTDKNHINIGEEIVFTNKSIGSIDSIKWYISDKFITSENQFKYLFQKEGLYSVKLVVFSDMKNDTLIKESLIQVNSLNVPKIPNFEISQVIGIPSLNIKLKNTSEVTFEKYLWELDSNIFSTEANPSYTYFKTGIFRISLFGIDGNDTSKITKIINVLNQDVKSKYSAYGSYDSSPQSAHNTNFYLENLLFLGNYSYAYIDRFENSGRNGGTYYEEKIKTLVHVNPYFPENNYKIKDVNNFYPYLDEGIITNKFQFYNKVGQYLFTKVIDIDCKIIPDNENNLIFCYKNNILKCYDKYFSELWNYNCVNTFSKNSEILDLIIYSNNIKVLTKNSVVYLGYEVLDLKGNSLQKRPLNISFNSINKRSENLYLSKHNSLITILNDEGNIINQKQSLNTNYFYLDSLFFITIEEDKGKVRNMIVFNNSLDTLVNYFDQKISNIFAGGAWAQSIMLDDKSIIIASNFYDNNCNSYEINRILFKNIGQQIFADSKLIQMIDKIFISPNPATDYITISLSPAGGGRGWTPEIFNIFGEKESTPSSLRDATPQEGNLRIDVSNLAPGVYFIRIGDKFEKFIKI